LAKLLVKSILSIRTIRTKAEVCTRNTQHAQTLTLGASNEFTSLRATLFFVAENQNVTLSVPRELLRRVKRLAADRDTSVSALMTEALARLTDEHRRYSAARKRALGAMKSAKSLGTRGRGTWTRDELHER
jgi:Ribbon-helix-helix protein, copG family